MPAFFTLQFILTQNNHPLSIGCDIIIIINKYCQQLFLPPVNNYYKPVFPHSSLFISTHQKPQKPHDIEKLSFKTYTWGLIYGFHGH